MNKRKDVSGMGFFDRFRSKNKTEDPLEDILVQNEQRMHPIIITVDPMEEVLSAYERE